MCEKNGISGGEGGPFVRPILENPEGSGVIGKIPSVGGGGGGMDIFSNYTLWINNNNNNINYYCYYSNYYYYYYHCFEILTCVGITGS